MGRLSKSLTCLGAGLMAAALAVPSPAAAAPLVAFVSVPPQASVVRDVGGPHVVVHCLVQAGQDPHVFEPTPKQIRALGRAKVFFTVGMPFERPVLERIRGQLPNMEVIDAFAGFARQPASDCGHDHPKPPAAGHSRSASSRSIPGGLRHDHGPGDSNTDPHVWLSPDALKTMAKNTAATLARLDPAHQSEFQRRLKQVNDAIDEADARVRAKLAPYRGRAVYVFHPALGYFCGAYGLRQRAVEVDDRSPSSRQLRELIRQAKRDGARVVFVQEGFDPHGARAVARAIAGRLVTVDPLAEDAVANLEHIAEAIASGLDEK